MLDKITDKSKAKGAAAKAPAAAKGAAAKASSAPKPSAPSKPSPPTAPPAQVPQVSQERAPSPDDKQGSAKGRGKSAKMPRDCEGILEHDGFFKLEARLGQLVKQLDQNPFNTYLIFSKDSLAFDEKMVAFGKDVDKLWKETRQTRRDIRCRFVIVVLIMMFLGQQNENQSVFLAVSLSFRCAFCCRLFMSSRS